MGKRGSILLEAHKIINGEREDRYGAPEDSFARIAEYWTAYLKPWTTDNDLKLEAKDVAIMMLLFKLARWENKDDYDSIVDATGYLGIAGDM